MGNMVDEVYEKAKTKKAKDRVSLHVFSEETNKSTPHEFRVAHREIVASTLDCDEL